MNLLLLSSIKSGQSDKIANALSKINLFLHEFQVNVLWFDGLKEMYGEDAYFKEAYETYENHVSKDRIPWMDYMIKEVLLF